MAMVDGSHFAVDIDIASFLKVMFTIIEFEIKTKHSLISSRMKCPRWLRQWDHLSLYLFLLCAKCLSSLFTHHVAIGDIKGLQISRCSSSLNDQLFVYDCIQLCSAIITKWEKVSYILDLYKRASGQSLNM